MKNEKKPGAYFRPDADRRVVYSISVRTSTKEALTKLGPDKVRRHLDSLVSVEKRAADSLHVY